MPETPHANYLLGTRLKRFKVIVAIGPSMSIKTLKHPDIGNAKAQL